MTVGEGPLQLPQALANRMRTEAEELTKTCVTMYFRTNTGK